MNYTIVTTKDFESNFKRLSKKYHSLHKDYELLIENLLKNPTIGYQLSANVRKVRMAISSKNRGKSGGARVITFNVFVNIMDTDIYLLTIYDKNEKDTISTMEIEVLKRRNGLLI